MSWLRRRINEAVLAISFMTRVPMPFVAGAETIRQSDCLWAYPLVGLIVGGSGAACLGLATTLWLPAQLAALLAVAITAIVTGAMHEDGLADFADGVGGGRSKEQKLEIMRDSRIGTFGALALIVSIFAKVEALASLPAGLAPGAFVLIHILARGLLAVPFLLLGPARADGLGQGAGRPQLATAGVALLIGALSAAAVELNRPFAGLTLAIVVVLAVLAVCRVAQRYLGGATGDVYGAAEQAAEVAGLMTLAAIFN